MIKAVFFDVDGTLLSHESRSVPESARIALNRLAEKGIRRIVATGRSMMELEMLPVKDIVFDGYILLNGQLCLDCRKKAIAENPITGTAKEHLLRLFNEKRIPIVLVEKDRMYLNFSNRYVELAQQAVSTPVPETGSYTGNEIYLAVAYLEQKDDALLQQLTGCKATRWNEYGVDIVSASGGKTAGIKEYLRLNQILQEETMAFGDGENDIEMLRYAQIGVAMGNADSIVKENADYVTDWVDADGILNALTSLHIL